MDSQTEDNTRQILVQDMDKGHLASLLQGFLKEWLEQYQEVIIENLKRCPEEQMGRFRSLLLASEAFETKIRTDIMNGLSAEEELLQLNREAMEGHYEDDTW